METKELTKILLSSIEREIHQWAEESGHIINGYDYETKFTERVRANNQILLQKSVDSNPYLRFNNIFRLSPKGFYF